MRIRSRIAAALLLVVSSCASVDFQRTTPSSGTFESSAWSITFFSIDIPGPSLTIARSNAAATGQPNLIIEQQYEIPYLGWFDWVLDLIGIRYGKVSGTWGYPPDE